MYNYTHASSNRDKLIIIWKEKKKTFRFSLRPTSFPPHERTEFRESFFRIRHAYVLLGVRTYSGYISISLPSDILLSTLSRDI